MILCFQTYLETDSLFLPRFHLDVAETIELKENATSSPSLIRILTFQKILVQKVFTTKVFLLLLKFAFQNSKFDFPKKNDTFLLH